jgi:hypothetical protein
MTEVTVVIGRKSIGLLTFGRFRRFGIRFADI